MNQAEDPHEADPEYIASTADLYAKVVMVLTEIYGEQADLLTRFLFGGESPADLASSCGKTESTVRRMIAQAFLDLILRLNTQMG